MDSDDPAPAPMQDDNDKAATRDNTGPQSADPAANGAQKGWIQVILSAVLFVGGALIIGNTLKAPPLATAVWDIKAFVLGLLAIAPMGLMLAVLMMAKDGPIAGFRNQQLDFFERLGFRFTPVLIIGLSLAAGFGEEMAFRGVFQTVLARYAPIAIAILVPAVVFGFLHPVNRVYIAIAAGVGAYLGLVFYLTGNIAVPILAHTVYDVIALIITQRALDRRVFARQSLD